MRVSLPFPELIRAAEESNVRLEMIRGVAVWEASPVFLHQQEIKRIVNSIKRLEGAVCACIDTQDTLFRFPDGSFKRPDVALLCAMPDAVDADEALSVIPAAVVEVLSKDYEYKDLVLSPPFYLENGVKDVLIFDPRTGVVLHHRPDWDVPQALTSPVQLVLECGCEITV